MTHPLPSPAPRPDRSPVPAAPRERRPDPRFAVLRDLIAARRRYGLNKGDLGTLRAMLFCLHGGQGTIVYACNETLSRHADGMPVRTLSRHIGRLVAAGFALRRDSPTRRRYVIRRPGGIAAAFGIDLAPLFDRAEEIAETAREVATEDAEVRVLKTRLAHLSAELDATGDAPDLVAEARLERRRQPCPERLQRLHHRLCDALETRGRDVDAAEMADADSRNGRPDQKADSEEYIDLVAQDPMTREPPTEAEPAPEPTGGALGSDPGAPPVDRGQPPSIAEVIAGCPEAAALAASAGQGLRSWHDMHSAAHLLAGWIGIDRAGLEEAGRRLGLDGVAVTIFCLVERIGTLRSPGAYLRSLSRRDDYRPAAHLRRLLSAGLQPA